MEMVSLNGENYEKVQRRDYVEELLNKGSEKITAEKKLAVIAKKADKKEVVTVYTSDGNVETEELAQPGEWILTRAGLDGEVFIDSFGHSNSWIMKSDYDESGNIVKSADEKLAKKYDVASMTETGFVKPKGGPQTFISTDRNIVIEVPWGENGALVPQKIAKGGFLNITHMDDIYGIAKEEFEATYAIM